MSWIQIIQLGLAMGIILYVHDTWKKHKQMKTKIDRLKDDMNVEFRGPHGSASMQRKHYPDTEVKDDFRQGTSDEKDV